ncbi:4-hydroxy-3-methylbut-2-enyl diphosphate reductase [Thermosipho ferrireducens]|uniref:4-hydroxy-3-methylbut-2-enyl diphosphate reductase n=1 Tax=Thermosipho ferrireducens TaxID=2571116 RepID=A0ABX7S569_9BACT|nr:4-hydroxy-3-methylbut-2-enyl diphosphate reductase [Thermosipho ferrireducens]QTA37659.1 4-hydroxy-3-methylbut-2-enyl diphosphate reductase [Thermosipho ferrireducens]
MQIIVARNIGFCSGVDRAVKKTKELLEKGYRVFTDDDIVHNKNVMNDLLVSGLSFEDGEVFLVRAHGLPPEKIREYEKKYRVVNLTCPIVMDLFEKAKRLREKGYKIVVFGKKSHPEMIALKGYVSDAMVTKVPGKFVEKKVAFLSQTTSSLEEFNEFICETTKISKINELLVCNTICDLTIKREEEVKKLSKICDLIIVIGGKHSSNTLKLARLASINTSVLHVESVNELINIPDNVKKVGIVSGTSTSVYDVEKVIDRLKELGGMLENGQQL